MPSPYIRPVDRADLKAIAALERQCFSEPWPANAFAEFSDAEGFLVAIDPVEGMTNTPGQPLDGHLAGYIVTTPAGMHDSAALHIRNLAVDTRYRRQGVASRLIRASVNRYPDGKFSSVRLEVRPSNSSAIALYRHWGFRVIKRIPQYYEDGEAALVMSRPIDAAIAGHQTG